VLVPLLLTTSGVELTGQGTKLALDLVKAVFQVGVVAVGSMQLHP
jgi:hypothetical protein